MIKTSRAKTLLTSIIKEPLVHFLILGGLLFFISAHFNPASPEHDQQTIVITNQHIEQLRTRMSSLLKRELTPPEMQSAIDQYITEEVLLREGLKLGVVEEDPGMRRNVAEKVKFLLSDTTLAREPTEGMLQEFMQKNPALFTQPPRRSFIHIYFDPAKHTTTLESDVKKAQQKLLGKTKIDPLMFGDRFVASNEYQQIDQITIAQTFGNEFANSVFKSPLNEWQKPISSPHGVHLVLVSEEVPSSQPTFNEIREQVRKVYLAEQHRLQNETTIKQLKEQYQIIIEQPTTLTK
jgi:peptidyl-prolyl cis-trans isomerase C